MDEEVVHIWPSFCLMHKHQHCLGIGAAVREASINKILSRASAKLTPLAWILDQVS